MGIMVETREGSKTAFSRNSKNPCVRVGRNSKKLETS